MDKKTRELGKAWKQINESYGPLRENSATGESINDSAKYMLTQIHEEGLDDLAVEDGKETEDRLRRVQEQLDDLSQFGEDYPNLKETTIDILKELRSLCMELSNMPSQDFSGIEEEMYNLSNTVESVVGKLNEGNEDIDTIMTPEMIQQIDDKVDQAEQSPQVQKAEQEVEQKANEIEQEGLNESYGWGYDGEIVM